MPPEAAAGRVLSLRRYLLAGILLPVGLFILINAVTVYSKTLAAVNTAYDRTRLSERKRHSFTIWKHYEAKSPLVPSGLLGPVKIDWSAPAP